MLLYCAHISFEGSTSTTDKQHGGYTQYFQILIIEGATTVIMVTGSTCSSNYGNLFMLHRVIRSTSPIDKYTDLRLGNLK